MLDLDEVKEAVRIPEVYHKLKKIDFPVEDPETLFVLLDYDESGELAIDEFITGCTRMRGDANSKDLLVAQVITDNMARHLELFAKGLLKCKQRLDNLALCAKSFSAHGEHVFLDARTYRMRHPDHKGQFLPDPAK